MSGKNKALGVPAGLKDYLPEEASLKRFLEGKWQELFSTWGYQEVVTPSFEYYTTLVSALGEEDTKLHKIIDREGRILALRPDMTNPIARLVAARYQKEQLPLRFFYLGNVFRYETELQKGRQREFYQAGVELLGVNNSWADAEVIALALDALEASGLEDYKIGLGHIKVTKELISALSSDIEEQKKLRTALAKKNIVAIDNLLSSYSEKAEVKEILTGQEQDDEIIKQLKKIDVSDCFLQAVADLENVLCVLKDLGLAEKVFIDLSILRDFDYYTGVVFEGYSSRLGYPLLGGGRYDNLIGNFGYECPATGFALGMERVMAALPSQEIHNQIDCLLIGDTYSKLFFEAKKLRDKGYKVEIDLFGMEEREATKYAQAKNISEVINLAGDKNE